MKKLFIFSFLLLIPTFISATSGACSYHGGVNCSIGRQGDGTVFCDDGWTDSMVYYEYTNVCEVNPYSKCVFPSYNYICTTEENYQEKLKNALNGMPACSSNQGREISGSFNGNSDYCKLTQQEKEEYVLNNPNDPWNLKIYKEQVELYKNALDSYNNCVAEVDSQINEQNSSYLDIMENYIKNTEKTNNENNCINIYGSGAFYNFESNGCQCKVGYEYNSISKKCITYNQGCSNDYGSNSYAQKGSDGHYRCYCNYGYEWNSNKTACTEKKQEIIIKGVEYNFEEQIKNFIKTEKEQITTIDNNLCERLKGRILLQVEDHGEAWYVNPKDGKKYYMANGSEAYNIMRYLGVGITNKDLDRVMTDKTFAQKHSGKIFLKVEANGEAYYIDVDGNSYYLKDGNEAYNIMRDLGLGITNNDLRKIDIDEIN